MRSTFASPHRLAELLQRAVPCWAIDGSPSHPPTRPVQSAISTIFTVHPDVCVSLPRRFSRSNTVAPNAASFAFGASVLRRAALGGDAGGDAASPAADVDSGPLISPQLDGEIAQSLRHLSKKDPVTKFKALQVGRQQWLHNLLYSQPTPVSTVPAACMFFNEESMCPHLAEHPRAAWTRVRPQLVLHLNRATLLTTGFHAACET